MSKYDYACLATAALAYLVLHQQDSVGLVTFDDQVRSFVRPSAVRGRLRLRFRFPPHVGKCSCNCFVFALRPATAPSPAAAATNQPRRYRCRAARRFQQLLAWGEILRGGSDTARCADAQ